MKYLILAKIKPKVNRYLIKLCFDGTRFHGWQLQPNAPTVQETLLSALKVLVKDVEEITGCGRTDTGVHAKEFYAHFDTQLQLEDTVKTAYSLNGLLPADILINSVEQVSVDLHARFSAISRTYQYHINFQRNPFRKEYACTIFYRPDVALMNEVCTILMQHNDFQCFSKVHTQVNNYRCTISEAFWKMEDEELVFTITANRFLRNMVRAIVGTMLELGNHKISVEEFKAILHSGSRADAGFSVPAKGLFLTKIMYPDEKK
jgi:tRNA pseudouridine38-40 synthase